LHAGGVFLLAPACWAALLDRYRRADRDRRAQLAWPLRAGGLAVTVPVGVVVAGALLGAWLPLAAYQVVAAAALAAVPAAVVVAVIRHRLYRLDVKADSVVNRLVVHTVLTVLGTGAFLTTRALFDAGVDDGVPLATGLIATVVAVVAVLLLRPRLERLVDRLLYRRRRYDYRVLNSLGRSLRTTLGTDALLPTVVQAVATGLRLPYASIGVGQGPDDTVAAASWGRTGHGGDLLVLPLVYQGEPVGRLTVAPRVPGEPFDATDRRLLTDVAGQVAVVAFALCLTADLQRARERLVAAREEERSRLRRDLHDGLQPALSGVMLGLDAARNLLGRSGGANELLALLKTELETAAADVRGLVYGLRPPALDELGLVGALRQQATVFSLSPTGPEVIVTAPDDLCALPAAVEVAAFRICQEALENVRKHAAARTCEITVGAGGGDIRIEVSDDGRGMAPDAVGGVGLRAMRERAAELGGSCTVQSAPGAGTSVRAVLPLARR
ncbi:MAG: GAF domain-containing sensor histidine kinase, partial [Actinomycetota bacterium]|nr:GAF domain-containing sensor histidine kinase [Actinomycetota bacterium]